MRNEYYNVRPRYTAGSPAMVREEIATQVAREERHGYAMTLEGWYGDDAKQEAEKTGLRRISESVIERADCWLVTDLITGERYVRPFEVWRETPTRQWNRFHRLRTKYGLPLQSDLK